MLAPFEGFGSIVVLSLDMNITCKGINSDVTITCAAIYIDVIVNSKIFDVLFSGISDENPTEQNQTTKPVSN